MWVHDVIRDVWHLIWETQQSGTTLIYVTWCGKTFDVDAPRKPGTEPSFMDVFHDDCVRKSEEL